MGALGRRFKVRAEEGEGALLYRKGFEGDQSLFTPYEFIPKPFNRKGVYA